tara:strand:- start:90 stop:1022 length:933 start_codon:yes stop_codon:yes gene_type:complete
MYIISALYKFHNIPDPRKIHNEIREELKKNSIKGTVLVGSEGINGTISARCSKNLNESLAFIRSISGFKNIDIKNSFSKKSPFVRLKVKLKKEIVTIGDSSVNPNINRGDYVEPNEWNKIIEDEDVLLIDTRNKYECTIGTFRNALNPNTTKFREFPKWLESQNFSDSYKKNKKVAMFCTGGIRCEKASSLMKTKGFKNVYHLKGGILNYFESVPEKESLWNGECFVFDDRVSIKHDLSEGTYDMCHGCRMPITDYDKKSKNFIKGVACPKCFDKTSDEQKSRYMSRQKQIDIAKKRNKQHIGPREEVIK